MTTACWATNEDFDCAWVYYGYGSRHDMMHSPGFWLSLKGILILAEYDYEYITHEVHLKTYDNEDAILIDRLGIVTHDEYGVDVSEEMYHLLPPEKIMEYSAITIKHPEGLKKSLEWFELARKASGKYPKMGYTEKDISIQCGGTYQETTTILPSMDKIKEINPYHYECHKNVDYREELAIDSLDLQRKWKQQWGGCMATKEDIHDMLESWDKEKDTMYENSKKNWELL